MRKFLYASVMTIGMVMMQVPAFAAFVPISGASLTVGDKLFNQFTCEVSQIPAGSPGIPVDCSGIKVQGATDGSECRPTVPSGCVR